MKHVISAPLELLWR